MDNQRATFLLKSQFLENIVDLKFDGDFDQPLIDGELFLDCLERMINLEHLSISCNSIRKGEFLQKLEQLKSLRMSMNCMNIESIKLPKQLACLDVEESGINVDRASTISQLEQLRYLNVSNNEIGE